MLYKPITRRGLLRMLGLAVAGSALAACAPNPAPTPVSPTKAPVEEATKAPAVTAAPPQPSATPAPAKEFEIVQWVQVSSDAYQRIADEYRKLHGNVKITWYTFPGGDIAAQFNEWLQARMVAQDAPDLFWSNTEELWPHVSKGWVLPFDAAMDTPNPYVSGNKAWREQFQEISIISQTGPDGHLYGVCMDGNGVLTVYNKDAFKDAGLGKEPRTWGEFKEAWQALERRGYIPYGADLGTNHYFPNWTSCHLYNQLVWDKVWDWDDDKNKVITGMELAIHTQKGDFPDWDAYLKMVHLVKEMAPFFPNGYEGEVDFWSLFRQGKVVMYMCGAWFVADFKKSPVPFDYGWLAYPIITKDIWPSSSEKVVRIQGAWGALQFHAPGYLAQKDPDKVPVIMDWLKFNSQPQYVTALCEVFGTLPLVSGAKAIPELAAFDAPYDRAVPYTSWITLSPSAWQAEARLWQEYVPSEMTDDQFLTRAKAVWSDEVRKVLEANPQWKIG